MRSRFTRFATRPRLDLPTQPRAVRPSAAARIPSLATALILLGPASVDASAETALAATVSAPPPGRVRPIEAAGTPADPPGAEAVAVAVEAIDGTTFDEHGQAVGQSSLAIETAPDGKQRMHVELAVEGGGRNVSQAVLVPVVEGAETGAVVGYPSASRKARMRILEQRSQATTAEGHAYPLLVIDHLRGRVSCYPEDEDPSSGRHVEIGADDRVVNVPMQMLFEPLVEGDVETLQFQIALCNDGPVIHRMIATRAPIFERDGRRILEIRYGPDLGKTVAWFASRLLPSFSFWFDADDGRYLGHRMPLHRKGPEVLLVRQGLRPTDLGVD